MTALDSEYHELFTAPLILDARGPNPQSQSLPTPV